MFEKMANCRIDRFVGSWRFFGYKHLHTQELRPEADWDRETDSVVTLDEKDKYPLDTRTFSNIKVKKVFKGDDLVKEGDELPVLEYYAQWRDLAGAYAKFPNELYKPLTAGKSYLLFLYQSPEEPSGAFEIIGNHQGKYVLPSNDNPMTTLTINELDIAENNEHYTALYQEVSQKYFDRQ